MEKYFLDVAHMLAGGLVLVSFMLLYQDRMYGLLNVFALHAVVLSASVAWQAHIQGAPHLYLTATIALVLKGIIIPVALHRVVARLGIQRTIETVVAVKMARRVIRHLARPQQISSMEDELIYQTFINKSEDYAEMRNAHAEGRAPVYKGS